MRSTIIIAALLLSACSGETDVDAELAERDAQIAELSDANAALEERVEKLEEASGVLARAAMTPLAEPVKESPSRSLPRGIEFDPDRDRLESRVTDLERDAGRMPPP